MQQTFDNVAHTLDIPIDQVTSLFEQRTLLKRIPALTDAASVAVFLASDAARSLTGTIINASNGTVID